MKKPPSKKSLDKSKYRWFTRLSPWLLGFVIFVISDMNSQVLLGILTAFTLSICLATDINLLPSILVQTKLITTWDYLRIKYTDEFLQGINLFQNMNIRESKLATLVTDTKDFHEDIVVFHENDPAHNLYLILEGGVDIYLEGKYHQEERMLATLKRGRTFYS